MGDDSTQNDSGSLASTVTSAPAQDDSQDSPGPSQITLPAPDASNNGGAASLSQSPNGGSRLGQILAAVSKVATTGLAAVPDKGRPSVFTGLGQGARAAQQAQANDSALKFKTFDDQLRAAALHNQDLELQMHTQEQQDAHQKQQDMQHDWDDDHGISYDTIPNSAQAVTDHLTAQTTANGAASIPAGTHLSADGQSILIPKQNDDTQAGLLQKYNTFREAYGLPSLPQGAQFVPPKMVDMLQNRLEGHSINGDVYNHDTLPVAIADLQSTRKSLAAKPTTDPAVLKQVDSTIGSMQAKLDYLDQHAAGVARTTAAAKAQGAADVVNNPSNQQGAAQAAGAKAAAVAANKPQKAQSTDWVPGVSADEKKKAELAENIAYNANEVAKLVMKRPDLLGSVAGRYTNTQQMVGNNDPDISALGTHVHNMAMANSGVHGFRSQEGVESFEKQLLNNFKNGPAALAGALRASTGSVQTFIDNARPQTYRTHSKQGGAVRGMQVTQ